MGKNATGRLRASAQTTTAHLGLSLAALTLLTWTAASPALGQAAGGDLCFNVLCPPLDDCHDAGTCDPATGLCSTPFKPVGTPCNDGFAVTLDDVCVNGVCTGTVDLCFGVACPSLDDCHDVGTCDPPTGLCSTPLKPEGTPCNDSNTATENDVCVGGVCVGVFNLCFAVDCRPLDDCHEPGICDPRSGACSNPNRPDGTPCNDGNSATLEDVCRNGDCAGVFDLCFAVDCRPLDDCHKPGTCDPRTGACSNPNRPDGTPCNDGNSATLEDVCRNGDCAGVFDLCFAVSCRPLDDCHSAGTCDPRTGGCSNPNKPDGTPCNDGNAATLDDVCRSGDCAGTYNLCPGVRCVAPAECHVSMCQPSTGDCIVRPKPDGTPCDDGDPKTFKDACENGVCVGDEDLCRGVVCAPLDPCHDAACDPATGRCLAASKPNGTPCDDGWDGTDSDVCNNGVCAGESLYTFSGFLSPVGGLPAVNRQNGGASAVVKFSLDGDFGLGIMVAGYPMSSPMTCGSAALRDGDEPTVGAGGGSLSYDPLTDRYSYNWKTDKSWRGTCRQLVIRLHDGSFLRGNFDFR